MSQSPELPGKATSLWIDTTPSTDYEQFNDEITPFDVVVIGAGIAGLTTAYLLREAGKKVAVIDSGKIAEGVTGFTTAKITSNHNLIYSHIIQHFGQEKAAQYAGANQAGLEFIAKKVEELAIECDFSRRDAYTYSTQKSEIDTLKKEVEAAVSLGLPAEFTTKTDLPFPVAGAVKFTNQAQFHPRKYLLALAKVIEGGGSRIYEETRALDCSEEGECTVTTNRGKFSAHQVVIATHFPFYDKAFYFSRMSPQRSYVIACTVDGSLPEGMYINSESPVRSIRPHSTEKGDYLLVGGENHKVGQGGDTRSRYQRLEAFARENFKVRSVEYHWSTQDNWTSDRVPYIGPHTPISKNIYVATGFGGWGMTNGTVAGMVISDLIVKKKSSWQAVFDPNRFKPLASTPTLIKENINVAQHFIKGLLKNDEVDLIKSLKNEEARVGEVDGKKVAVYKDEQGEVHALSAICTHMGCTVSWNNAEKSWDCPCHGSRFNYRGHVLHGPAVEGLLEVSL